MTLEQLARERGVFFSDRSQPCIATGSGSPGSQEKFQIRGEEAKEDQCIINFLGSDITTASFAMYTFSAAVLVQAVTLICLSSFADYGMYFSQNSRNSNPTRNSISTMKCILSYSTSNIPLSRHNQNDELTSG